LAIGDLCFFISKNGELRCFYENNQDSFEHTTSQLFWYLTGLTSKRRADAALICVKTAIKRYENSSSQCVFRTDSASEKSCGFLSFRFKNTKLFRPKAENGIFRHLCGRKFLDTYLFYKYPDASDIRVHLKKFLGDNQSSTILIQKITNEQSHANGDLENHELAFDVPEIISSAKIVLERIQYFDADQYNSLVSSVNQSLETT